MGLIWALTKLTGRLSTRRMKLIEWLRGKGMSEVEFARLIGRHKVSVCRYVRGVRRPDGDTMDVIREVTGGLVDRPDFPRKGR